MMLLPQTPNFALAAKLGLDLAAMTDHVRTQLAQRLPGLEDDAIRALLVDHGGTLDEPGPSNWAALEYEISLLGVSARGETLHAAAHQWAKAASRMARADPAAV